MTSPPLTLLVIGSGPAGVHAVKAYVEAGPGPVGLLTANVELLHTAAASVRCGHPDMPRSVRRADARAIAQRRRPRHRGWLDRNGVATDTSQVGRSRTWTRSLIS